MPIYEYHCEKCGQDFECLIMGSDKPECTGLQQQEGTQAHVRLRVRQQGRRRCDRQVDRRLRLRELSCRKLRGVRSLMGKAVTIGTRGSKLALWQAEWVRAALSRRFPGTAIELMLIKTQGDKILDVPLAKVGGKGLFVKEIEEALQDGRVDLAVHSMKDMPADIPAGLAIGAVPERETPIDVLISRGDRLPEGLAGRRQRRHQQPAPGRAAAACAAGPRRSCP